MVELVNPEFVLHADGVALFEPPTCEPSTKAPGAVPPAISGGGNCFKSFSNWGGVPVFSDSSAAEVFCRRRTASTAWLTQAAALFTFWGSVSVGSKLHLWIIAFTCSSVRVCG